jgi:hypothetical protein
VVAIIDQPQSTQRGTAMTLQEKRDAFKAYFKTGKPPHQINFCRSQWCLAGATHLRHAAFVALRNDEDPRDVRRE